MTTPNRRFFIGNQQPNSYHASLRRSSALSTPPSSFNFNSAASSPPSVNPDPLPSRRKSFDTLDKMDQYPSLYNTNTRTRSGSTGDLSLSPPNPPFAATATRNSYRDSSGSDMSSSSSFDSPGGVYRSSAAAHLVTSQSSPNVSDSFGGSYPASLYGGGGGAYSPSASQVNFRPAFLSPASRPTSSLQGWVPPTSSASSVDGFPSMMGAGGATSTGVGVGLRANSRNASRTNIRPSTLLVKESVNSLKAKAAATPALPTNLDNEKHLSPPPPPPGEKPTSPLYNTQPLPRTRTARYLTLLCILIGLVGAAILCFTGVQEAKSSLLEEGSLCLVMDEDWSGNGGELDGGRWGKEVELGGFGNGEFQMTTAGDKNVYIKNGELYIFPTLTSEDVPDWDQDGKKYVLEGCTGAGGVPAPASSGGGNSTENDNGGNSTDTSGGGNNTTTNGGGKNNGGGGGDNTGGNTDNGRRWLLPRQRATSTHSSSASSPSASANSTSSSSSSPSSSSNSTSSPNTISNPNTSGPGRDTNACVAETSYGGGTVVNPVMSGRVSTRGRVGVRYGRVEVRAKVGRGDWLWPAIWMLPENNTYGAWPLSGEIDIMEARGNAPTYPAQGVNYVRSSLNYGLSKGLLPIAVQGGVTPEPLTKSLYGWFSLKRTSFDQAFHTYAVEWDEDFMRFYVDSRVKATLQLKVDGKKGGKGKNGKTDNFFWDKGKFPATAQNGTTGQVEVVENPWEEGGKNAPFDQKFYLILDHAVGGTSGWFPDELGNKPWYDGSLTAMRDFAKAQDEWYPTWGSGEDDRAFRIKSVKMWSRECS